MKCPKCAYLGFETGDRCKNCGYDFSLLASDQTDPADDVRYTSLDGRTDAHEPSIVANHVFRAAADVSVQVNGQAEPYDRWFDERHQPAGRRQLDPIASDPIDDATSPWVTPPCPFAPEPAAPSPAARGGAPRPAAALPLFRPGDDADDEPLIKMPATPRAPLAVRRTPETPRARPAARPLSRPAPALQFSEEPLDAAAAGTRTTPQAGAISNDVSRTGSRLTAAVVDHAILTGIDLGVVYFTVRMAGLSMSEWTVLPIVPMLTFLGLLKISYFYAFTAVGGQTIGKMAVGTCVIGDDGAPVDAARAMRRTCAGLLSVLLFGLGFAPALFGHRRALHDRLAGTRVVRLRPT